MPPDLSTLVSESARTMPPDLSWLLAVITLTLCCDNNLFTLPITAQGQKISSANKQTTQG